MRDQLVYNAFNFENINFNKIMGLWSAIVSTASSAVKVNPNCYYLPNGIHLLHKADISVYNHKSIQKKEWKVNYLHQSRRNWNRHFSFKQQAFIIENTRNYFL